MVYLLPFSSYLAGSKSVSARPSDSDTNTNNALLRSYHFVERQQKSQQIVGPRPSMCGANFPYGKQNVNPLTVLVHLQLLYAQRGKELGLS